VALWSWSLEKIRRDISSLVDCNVARGTKRVVYESYQSRAPKEDIVAASKISGYIYARIYCIFWKLSLLQ